MKEITLHTKISDLLNNYEGMEEQLIKINPKFKKLRNPVLRRTVAKVAGVKQAAIVGGMDPYDLLNQLRDFVGQERVKVEDTQVNEQELLQDSPDWINNEVKITIDANELLDEEKNPLAVSKKNLKNLKEGELLSIVSDFKPQPLIDEFIKSGFEVYSQEIDSEKFLTFVKK